MTDNEIIKALECCKNNKLDDCENCPRLISDGKTTMMCMSDLMNDALDLINRQKEEIERLNKAIKVLEIMTDQHAYDRRKAATEAIKEFAERLKAEVGCFGKHITDGDIDTLVKEMVGDNNG